MKALRKTHRKSRMGCAFCKRRRIKCDEGRPACSNCVKREIPCEYSHDSFDPQQLEPSSSRTRLAEGDFSEVLSLMNTITPDQNQSTQPASVPNPPHQSPSDPVPLNIVDLELLHAWENSTGPSLARYVSRTDAVDTFCRKTVPEIGFAHPFVLHAALAIAATHLSRFKRSDRAHFYRREAERHWDRGFAMVTARIPHAADESYHAFFTFTILSCVYKLAKGPSPGDYLVFSDGDGGASSSSEWNIYHKGYDSFLEVGLASLRTGPLAHLFDASTRRKHKYFEPPASGEDPAAVAELRARCADAVGPGHPRYAVYKTAIDNLACLFSGVYDGEDDGEFNVFVWTLQIKEEFVACVQGREPMALVIFAYYVALLHELSGWWALDGWVHHIMSGIYHLLSEGMRSLISWPMAQTGWLPP